MNKVNNNDNLTAEEMAIKEVIKKAYIEGVHINRDPDAMKVSFDSGFEMKYVKDNQVGVMTLEQWIGFVERLKGKFPEPSKDVEYNIPMISVAGDAAVARIEVYKGSKHIYSDFFSLYKVDGEWKIVSKIYHAYK